MLTEQGPEDPRVRRTRRMLKEAFIELMQIKTYQEITVKDIVKQADYNRATFYHHFKYKEQLADEVVADKLDGFVVSFRYPFSKIKANPAHGLTTNDIIVFDYIINNADFFLLFKHSDAIPGFTEKLHQTTSRLFQETNQSIHPSYKMQNQSLLIIQSYGLMGLIFEWIKSEFSSSSYFLAQQLIQLFYFPASPASFNEPIHFV